MSSERMCLGPQPGHQQGIDQELLDFHCMHGLISPPKMDGSIGFNW